MASFVKDLAKSAWFLDYDGTLCPHQEVWEERQYRPEDILSAVQLLHKRAPALFWNTGRRMESLQGVNARFLDYPGYFVQGSFYWNSDTQKNEQIGMLFPDSLTQTLKERLANEKQYRLEIKPTGARIAPLRRTQKKYLRKFIESLNITLSGDWEWRIGDRGGEILHKNFSKGSALEHAYKNKLIPEEAIPIVAGDDFFDRAAMEFALARGGYAVLVGEGCGWITEIPHRSSQVLYFREPRDFLMFLKGL